MAKVRVVIGCESCQVRTEAVVSAKTKQEAFYRATLRHSQRNTNCDEFDASQCGPSGLFLVETSKNFLSLPMGDKFVPRKSRADKLLEQILA